jgi:hypothetical protein
MCGNLKGTSAVQTRNLIVVCGAALIGLGIWRFTSTTGTPPPAGSPGTAVPVRPQYANTLDFWKRWAAKRKQSEDALAPLRENEFAEHALKCAEWSDWLAQETLSIPQLGVDPELTRLAVDFSELYRERAEAWRFQAALMQAAAELRARGDSGWTAVEAFVRGVQGDPFGVANELLEANGQLEKAARDLQMYWQAANTKFTDLRNRRDQLRARLISEYGEELP